MTDNSKIDKIQQQIQALKEQLKQEKAKQTTRQRKIDTRKKILLGAMMMHWVEIGKITEPNLLKELEQFLTRESDRALFGLASSSDYQTANHSSNNTDSDSKVSNESETQKSITSNQESRSRLKASPEEDIEKEFNF